MAELFESNWSATKDALLEGLNGSRKSSLDVVLENTKRYINFSQGVLTSYLIKFIFSKI